MNSLQKKVQGIYAITDPSLIADEQLKPTVMQAIAGGLSVLQYRNKTADPKTRLAQAECLRELCQQHQVLFLVNDDVDLAKQLQADGVHIGRDDGAIKTARHILGESAIIGVSCYNQLQNAEQAQQEGANYVAFGRFFSSQTKPQAVQAYPDLITQAKTVINLPIVAIGGITRDNAPTLIQAGADALAVIHGIFGQSDVKLACSELNQLYSAS